MEQMVTNPEIKKVTIVCDEKYAAKADGRSGGVGTDNAQAAKLSQAFRQRSFSHVRL